MPLRIKSILRWRREASVEGTEDNRRTTVFHFPLRNDATAFPTDQCSLTMRDFFWAGSPPLWLIFAYKLIRSYLPNNWVCIDCVFIFLLKKNVCVWRAVFFNCLSRSYLWSVLLLSLVWGVRRHFTLLKIMLFYPDGCHNPVQSGWSCSTFMTWYQHHCRLWYEYNSYYIHPYWFVLGNH